MLQQVAHHLVRRRDILSIGDQGVLGDLNRIEIAIGRPLSSCLVVEVDHLLTAS